MKLRVVLLCFVLLLGLGLAKGKTEGQVEVIVEFSGPQISGGSRAGLTKQLKDHLGKMKGRLKVQVAEGYWASQSVLVRLPESQVGSLLNVPGVRRVYRNQALGLAKPVAKALASPSEAGNAWALERIGAPQMWASGLKGQGIRIGHLDTGVDASHPELRGKIAAFAVIDADGTPRASNPYDSAEHGTYTAGLLVGNSVGVAPSAQLISALVLPSGNGTLAQVLGGLDWVLEQNVQVVSMSLGLQGTWSEFAPVIERMKQMGVLPVFAVGNTGAETTSPGNLPDVLGIGAADASNQVASFSSRGEVRWGDPYNVAINKPDLVAPGVGVFGIAPGGRYISMSGTSVSTALAAGSAALLMSGGAKAEQTRQALLGTALPLQAGSGKGLLQLVQAAAALGLGQKAAQQASAQPETTQATPVGQKRALLVVETKGAEAAQKALEALGYTPEVVKAKPSERPKQSQIAQFPLVVWVLPGNWAENWPEAQRKMLRAWVENGGRLLMISTNQGQKTLSESSSYGKGKATFASGDFSALAVEQRTQVFQEVLEALLH